MRGESIAARRRRALALLVAAAMVAAFSVAPARAETLRVGKAVAENFGFAPLDVGLAAGIFQAEGLEIESFDFTGGAKQQQALAAGSLDIALGGGTDLAFIVKGAPELAIASISTSPASLGLMVAQDSMVQSADDLKGKKIGVTSPGSLTMWLVEEFNRVKGWGSDGAVPVVIGGQLAIQTAALKTHQVDGLMGSPGTAYTLEEQKLARLFLPASAYVSDFEFFTILASTSIMQDHPDAVRRFLKGWYASIAFMNGHKAETVKIAGKATGFSQNVVDREYDLLMPTLSVDGRFKPKALEKLHTIFADLKILDGPLDLSKLTTEQFLPPM
jgi:NitT/TauT family transport system substrate-binding protein